MRYGDLPSVLVSDRDPRFASKWWELFCKRFKIRRALSSVWHAHTYGQTQKLHRTLEQVHRTYVESDESAWETFLPAAELAYNCAVDKSTGRTPFEGMIGENPMCAGDLHAVDVLEPTVTPLKTKLFQQLVERASGHILLAQAQQKQYRDKKRREFDLNPGDKVWLSSRLMQPRGAPKFQPRFIGPFKVLSKMAKVAYRLELQPSMK